MENKHDTPLLIEYTSEKNETVEDKKILPGFKSVFFEKVKDIISYILPSVFCFAIFALVFSENNIYPFGDLSISWCDLNQQGIPLLMNLKDILNGEGSIMYSFRNASGMNFWGVFLFFLSNPFSLICVFFEKVDFYKLVNVLVILKLCLSAFTASFFFRKCNKNLSRYFSVALALSYSLSAYGLMYYQNIMWLDLMYLYPLLAYGIMILIRENRYTLYTIFLSICVIFNFYLSYMVVVSVILIFGTYYFFGSHTADKKAKVAFSFVKGSVLAALISAIAWIPAFLQYIQSGRGESVIESLSESYFLSRADTTLQLLISTALIFVGFFSFRRRDNKRTITLIIFGLLFFPLLIEPIHKMWHMGSYMSFPGRFAFITIFTGLELTALALEEPEISKISHEPENQINKSKFSRRISAFKDKMDKSPKHIKVIRTVVFAILGAIVISFLYIHISTNYYHNNVEIFSKYTTTLWSNVKQFFVTLIAALIFLVAYFCSTAIYRLKVIPKSLFSLFLIGIITCESVLAINAYAVSVTRNYFPDYGALLDLEDKIDDDEFYRVRTQSKYYDTNLIGAMGYNSIGHYTSLTNLEYMNTAKALGYSSHWMKVSTYSGTELSDAILSVKYKIYYGKLSNSIYQNESFGIVETFGALGLGVKYSSDEDVFSYDEQSRIDFQEKIFHALFQSEEKLFNQYEPTKCTDCTIENDNGKTTIVGKGTIEYSIDIKETETLYFDAIGEFSNNLKQEIDKGFKVYVNGKEIGEYPDSMTSGLIKLGTFQNKTVNVKIETQEKLLSTISFGVAGLRTDVLKKALENTESGFLYAEDNVVYGSVDGKEGEKLFVSIPYDDGFKVTVNGKEIEATKVFGDFYSIPLTDGENVIEMKYTSPGIILGIVFTIIGIVATIAMFIFEKKNVKSYPKLEKISSRIVTSLFVLIISLIYIVPCFITIFL